MNRARVEESHTDIRKICIENSNIAYYNVIWEELVYNIYFGRHTRMPGLSILVQVKEQIEEWIIDERTRSNN